MSSLLTYCVGCFTGAVAIPVVGSSRCCALLGLGRLFGMVRAHPDAGMIMKMWAILVESETGAGTFDLGVNQGPGSTPRIGLVV